MNRRKLACVIVGLTCLLTVLGSSRTSHSEAKADKIVIRVGTVAPKDTPWGKWVKVWKKGVNEKVGEQIKIKTFYGGTLGGEKTMVRRCKKGSLEIFGGSTAAVAEVVPELSVLELPYMFSSEAEADFIIDNYLTEPIEKLLAKKGLKFLYWQENGWRSFATKFGPVKKPSDLSGRKMRSQESKVHIAIYKALGASPVPISVPEVLGSLQTGVVDGFDNTPLFSFATSWYQGIEYYNLTKHIYQPAMVVYNLEKWNALPEDVQAALSADRDGLQKKARKGVRKLTPLLLKNFTKAGKEVVKLSDSERAAFATKTKVVTTNYKKKANKDAKNLLSLIAKGKKAYKKK
jgi:tripartite ATP-independent transporter DctP family solute receptor